MNSLTHKWNLDGSLSRKPPKEGKRKKKKGSKPVPAKGKTSWGRIYADGREVCSDKPAGKREYERRLEDMIRRQNGRCKCGESLVLRKWTHGMEQQYAVGTFGHDIPRGNGGCYRDDRIVDANGKPMNHAECWECNSKKGSKRA